MVKKNLDKNENIKTNQGYVPSDYKHVQAVLSEATERTLKELIGPNWKNELNRRTGPQEIKKTEK
jgi:hypothetical protein